MNLREAAQLALDALESVEPWEVVDHDPFAAAITALRAALAEGAIQRLTDVHQEMDCYGDGNVYRGQRSSDSKTPTLTINGMPAVEGPLSESQLTCQESRQVEPVAYVTGYSKGRCIIEAIDPDWLMPVGMALYHSPPTISKTETVEPVAWLIESYDIYAKRTLQRLVFDNPKNMQSVKITAYYAAPPKRKPLTEEEITQCWQRMGGGFDKYTTFARAIERAHGIGGEK